MTGSGNAIKVGATTFRYLLTGSFIPGQVDVLFNEGTWDDTSARGPPSSNPANLAITETFSVAGSTADLVRTLPAHGDVPETIVALGGGEVGKDSQRARLPRGHLPRLERQ